MPKSIVEAFNVRKSQVVSLRDKSATGIHELSTSDSLQHKVLVIVSGDLEWLRRRESSGVPKFSAWHVAGEDPVLVGVEVGAV